MGRIGRPHGVAGALRVLATGPTLGELATGARLVARRQGHDREIVLADRGGAAPRLVLRFDGVATRDQAAQLTGSDLLAEAVALPHLDDADTFYVRDLVGLAVVSGGREVGQVVDVHPSPANDLLEVAGGEWSGLIPFTADAVVHMDMARRRIVVRSDLMEEGRPA